EKSPARAKLEQNAHAIVRLLLGARANQRRFHDHCFLHDAHLTIPRFMRTCWHGDPGPRNSGSFPIPATRIFSMPTFYRPGFFKNSPVFFKYLRAASWAGAIVRRFA